MAFLTHKLKRALLACLCISAGSHAKAVEAAAAGATGTAAVASSGPQAATLPSGGSEYRQRMLSWANRPEAQSAQKAVVVATGRARSARALFISSPFGWRSDPIKGIKRRHNGIDLPGRAGMQIHSTGTGIVSFAGWANGYGNLVQIDHPGGVRTRYGHLSRVSVGSGMRVQQGDVIGHMGSTGRSTGNHLHYEVRVNGAPVNPLAYIGQTAGAYETFETAWAPEKAAVARWTGWGENKSADALPSARIP